MIKKENDRAGFLLLLSDPKTALAAIRRADTDTLRHIADYSDNAGMRLAAIKRLDCAGIGVYAKLKDKPIKEGVWHGFVPELIRTNAELLYLAQNGNEKIKVVIAMSSDIDINIRMEAVNALSGKFARLKIIHRLRHGMDESTSLTDNEKVMAACARLLPREKGNKYVAAYSEDESEAMAAFGRINEQEELWFVAARSPNPEIRKTAVCRIEDEKQVGALIAKLVGRGRTLSTLGCHYFHMPRGYQEAIDNLLEKNRIESILEPLRELADARNENEHHRKRLAEACTFLGQSGKELPEEVHLFIALYVRKVTKSIECENGPYRTKTLFEGNDAVRLASLRKLGEKALAEVALTIEDDMDIAARAARKINDQDALSKIALRWARGRYGASYGWYSVTEPAKIAIDALDACHLRLFLLNYQGMDLQFHDDYCPTIAYALKQLGSKISTTAEPEILQFIAMHAPNTEERHAAFEKIMHLPELIEGIITHVYIRHDNYVHAPYGEYRDVAGWVLDALYDADKGRFVVATCKCRYNEQVEELLQKTGAIDDLIVLARIKKEFREELRACPWSKTVEKITDACDKRLATLGINPALADLLAKNPLARGEAVDANMAKRPVPSAFQRAKKLPNR